MKRKIALIGAAVLYIAVLAGLLYIQYQTIGGARSRGAANGAALVLAIPSAAVFFLLIRAGSPEGEKRGCRTGHAEHVRQAVHAENAEHVRQAGYAENAEHVRQAGYAENAEHLRQADEREAARHGNAAEKPDEAGESVVSRQDEARLQEILRGRYGLTARECSVSWLILRGYTNRQIAEELFISELTVKKHASHIYEKTGAFGRREYAELMKREVRKCE